MKPIKVGIFTLTLRKDGILHVHAEGDHIVSLKMYKELIEEIGKITGGKKVAILSTADELTIPDEDVKAYFPQPNANPYSLASAMIVPSLAQKLFVNFFMSVTKRKIRVFRCEEEAVTWLKTQIRLAQK